MNEMKRSRFSLAKYFAVRILALISLMPILAFVVGEVMGWPFLRQPAERMLSQQLDRQIQLNAPFKLQLLGGIRLSVGAIRIGSPSGFDAPYFVDANELELALRYSDLWQAYRTKSTSPAVPYRIKSLRAAVMDAYVIRNQDGTATWQFKQDDTTPPRPFPLIEHLYIGHGQALVQDAPALADLKVLFNTEEGVADRQPQSSIEIQGKLRQRPLAGRLETTGFLPVATLNKDSAAVHSRGWVEYGKVRLDFDGTVSDLFGQQNIRGSYAVKGPSLGVLGDLANVTLPTTDAFSFKGQIAKQDEVWTTQIKAARVGRSELAGDFKYDGRPQPPVLTGELRGQRFVLADLAPAFGTRNEDGSSATNKAGRAIPDRPLDLPSLNRMDANVDINLDYVDLGSAFSQPIAPLKSNLTIQHGKLALNNLDARTAKGRISGLISVDAQPMAVDTANPAPAEAKLAKWDIDLDWRNVDLEEWLQVSKDRKNKAAQEGKAQVPPAYVTGKLNGKTTLTGQGQSTAQLLGSLNGDVAFFIRHGSLSHLIIEVLGLDVAQAIGVIVKGDQSLPMECAVLDMSAKRGIITPKVALIDTQVTMILIDGQIDMATENLNLRLAAKPKNFSPLTLRSPIRVTGSFQHPKASPEAGPIAAKVLGSVALAFLNPLAAILPLIDPGESGDGNAEASCARSLQELQKHQGGKRLAQQSSVNASTKLR